MKVQNEPPHDMACVVKCEPPLHMEVETLWVSTWKKDINFENLNKFDWVEGVTPILDSDEKN